jgi:chromosome segregation ATPase
MVSFKEFLICLVQSLTRIGMADENDIDPNASEILVNPEEIEPENEEPEEAPEREEGDEGEEELVEAQEPKISRRQAEVIKLRKERQEADARVERLSKEIEDLKVRTTQTNQNTQEATIRQQEDAILNNPNADEWQKYAVKAQRQAREAEIQSKTALFEARNIRDKTDFQLKYSQSQPKAYNAYKERVESKFNEWASQGKIVSRSEIFKYLLGEDMAEGKLKVATKKPSENVGAKRPQTPNVRSDVRASNTGGLSEAQKRVKRLENIII